jgi:hypothetical protein
MAALGAFAALAASCGRPSGFLGARWGEETTTVTKRLQLDCPTWDAWIGEHGVEDCWSMHRPVEVYGRQGYVGVYRMQQRLEGIQVQFIDCDAAALNALDASVRKQFGIRRDEYDKGLPFAQYSDDSVVRLEGQQVDHTCLLPVAGPRFGKLWVSTGIAEGLSGLFRIQH